VDTVAAMASDDASLGQSLHGGIEERAMELAAMDAQLGMLVSREAAAGLAIDELAEAVEEDALLVLDRHGAKPRFEAQRGELAHSVGQERDAHAQLLHLARGFVDGAGDAALVQREREREAGDAAAHDRHAHPYSALMPADFTTSAQRTTSASISERS